MKKRRLLVLILAAVLVFGNATMMLHADSPQGSGTIVESGEEIEASDPNVPLAPGENQNGEADFNIWFWVSMGLIAFIVVSGVVLIAKKNKSEKK